MKITFLCLTMGCLVQALVVGLAQSESSGQTEAGAVRLKRMAWWREARFGLFIHWGPVSLQGTEISWSRANSNPKCPNKGKIPVKVYDSLYRQFNPTNFDAASWVQVAKDAGTKYIVLTAKHCDGFLLWHSKASDYNLAATPFRRDVCAELAAAARQQQMRLGWYFSPMDWRDPDFRTDRNAAFVSRLQAEIRELLSNYGPIDLLWFDYDGREAMYDQAHTYPLVKNLQPKILIDSRLDLNRGDNNRKMLSPYADYYTPEQQIGSYDDQRPWETCMPLGRQWSWKPNDKIKSVSEVVALLAKCAGGDGNLLLNVGPMPDGRIEPRQVAVLDEVGEWLKANSESIYGTRGGPYKPGAYGACTRKGRTVYLHVLNWPQGTLKLPAIPAKVKSARVLSGGTAEAAQSSEGLSISVPQASRKPHDTVVAIELEQDAMSLRALEVPQTSTPKSRL